MDLDHGNLKIAVLNGKSLNLTNMDLDSIALRLATGSADVKSNQYGFRLVFLYLEMNDIM